MNSILDKYVDDVMSYITADEVKKERIRRDLYSHIYEASAYEDIHIVLEKMGTPKEVAADFMENIYENKDDIIKFLIQERLNCKDYISPYYEYKSKTTLLGLPLIHVKIRKQYKAKLGRAKGIIAIGDIATGIFSVGAISSGLISLGAISLGLLSLGAITFGGFSIGAVAIGLFSLGAIAIGLEALGAVAIGKNVALGAVAIGKTAVGSVANGSHTLEGSNIPIKDCIDFLSNTLPGRDSLTLKLLKLFCK